PTTSSPPSLHDALPILVAISRTFFLVIDSRSFDLSLFSSRFISTSTAASFERSHRFFEEFVAIPVYRAVHRPRHLDHDSDPCYRDRKSTRLNSSHVKIS